MLAKDIFFWISLCFFVRSSTAFFFGSYARNSAIRCSYWSASFQRRGVFQKGIWEKTRPLHLSVIKKKSRATLHSHVDTHDACENQFLQGLSVEQRKVVSADFSCPIMVIAGPGSGKTRVITHRIAYMISKGVSTSKILAVTFTKKAADEMRQRVKKLLGIMDDADFFMSVGTFHGICNQILRDFALEACLPPSFTILDADDQFVIIKDILKGKKFTHEANDLRSAISRLKTGLSLVGTSKLRIEAEEMLPIYQAELARRIALDFDDLLLRTVDLLESRPAVCNALRQRWPHVLVDEFQAIPSPWTRNPKMAPNHKPF